MHRLGKERVGELQMLFSKKAATEGGIRERNNRRRLRKAALVELKNVVTSASPEWKKYMDEPKQNHGMHCLKGL